MLLFGAFALAIYSFVVGTFDFDAAQTQGQGGIHGAEQGFATLRTVLIVSYCTLLVVVPVVSYLLARSALTPVRRSYELQQHFVDGASHEMRTPLSVIQGELELALFRPRQPEEYQRAIASSLQATESLIRLANGLLILSRGDDDELRSAFADVDVNDLVSELAHATFGTGHPRLVLHLGPIVHVQGSQELLARAVGNLIDNAVKFTPTAGEITIETRAVGTNCVISVSDTGAGMAPNEVVRAFDRFWRSARARSGPAQGLGLSLVREIVSAHRGRATIDSKPGVGTRVTITLPL